jgi:hypothetical protein
MMVWLMGIGLGLTQNDNNIPNHITRNVQNVARASSNKDDENN